MIINYIMCAIELRVPPLTTQLHHLELQSMTKVFSLECPNQIDYNLINLFVSLPMLKQEYTCNSAVLGMC